MFNDNLVSFTYSLVIEFPPRQSNANAITPEKSTLIEPGAMP